MISALFRTLIVGLAIAPAFGLAHHNVTNVYDSNRIIEVEGIVTSAIWRNPHIQVSILVTDENGNEEVWDMASEAMSNLRRWNIEPAFIKPGDKARFAGRAAHQGNGMYISHVLTPSGVEVILDRRNFEPRWSENTITIAESRKLEIGNPNFPELGIFRVWSHPRQLGPAIPGRLSTQLRF